MLDVIDATNHAQYVILFKDGSGRCDLRGVYAVTGQEEREGQLTRVWLGAGLQPTSSLCPPVIDESQIDKFFKYSSGQKSFGEVVGQRSLTMTTDGVALRQGRKKNW